MDLEPRSRKDLPADRLRAAAAADRPRAFREVYDIVLQRILKEHRESGRGLHMGTNDKITRFIHANAGRGRSVLEIGCGFGLTAQQVGAGQRELVGIDAAAVAVETATQLAAGRSNLRFAVMDATRLEFPDERFDVVYSIDMVEHLHPDDLSAHLRETYRVLRPGGIYIVKTPSELTGPHEGDDPGEQGFLHFREYRYGTLLPLLRREGFRRLRAPAFSMRLSSRIPGRSRWPAAFNVPAEAIALLAPHRSRIRRFLARRLGVKQVIIIAFKTCRSAPRPEPHS